MKKISKMLLKLFFLFFKINLITTSGPASFGLTEKLVVPELISQNKFNEVMTIASNIPGSDAIQMAWQIGYHVGKIPGAIISVLGALTPCIALVSIVMFGLSLINPSLIVKFINGVKPVMIILLITTVISLLPSFKQMLAFQFISVTILAIAMTYFKVPLIVNVLICGFVSLIAK